MELRFPSASRLCAAFALCAFFGAAATVKAGEKNAATQKERVLNLDEAKAQAEKTRRTLVLEFGANWCGPCKEFDRRVLPHPSVQQALSGVLYIHYNAEEQPGRAAAQTLKVIGYPTFFAIGQDGRVIDRIEGYRSAREFTEWLARVSTDWESDTSLQVRLSRDPNDVSTLLVLGRRQAQRGEDKEAEATLARAAAQDRSKVKEEVAAAVDWELRIVRLRRMLREAPRKEMAEHLLAFPRGPNADAAFHELSRRGPADALTTRALERYVEVHLDPKDQKAQDVLNEAVYGCLRAFAYDAAERAARKLLSLDEKNPLYLDTLAEVLHLRGDRNQAMALSTRAVAAVDKQGETGKELRAVLLKNQARFSRAARELPAELLTEEEEISPWERTISPPPR